MAFELQLQNLQPENVHKVSAPPFALQVWERDGGGGVAGDAGGLPLLRLAPSSGFFPM